MNNRRKEPTTITAANAESLSREDGDAIRKAIVSRLAGDIRGFHYVRQQLAERARMLARSLNEAADAAEAGATDWINSLGIVQQSGGAIDRLCGLLDKCREDFEKSVALAKLAGLLEEGTEYTL